MAAVEELADDVSRENSLSKVPERLMKRHHTRQEDAEKRKEAKESHKLEEEQTEYFNSEFNKEKAAIEALLSACPGADRAAAAEALERAAAQTKRLQKFLQDSVPFLTQYDLRQAQSALLKLQTALNATREDALPKKKFAFRARTKATEKTNPEPPEPDETTTDGVGTKVDANAETEQCGLSDLCDANVTKAAADIGKRDVLLTRLRNCKVKLLGAPSSLHLKHIDGCEILCGPVSSSVFVDHCSNSVLSFPCQQLRTHNSTDTSVYVHVTSRAIIEDCTGLRFAPFAWSYPGLDADFQLSGLDRSRNNWDDVDDFNWLCAGTPSPNWTVIPEPDRRLDWAV